MKALITCSVQALCDISRLEREACNRACAQHGIPAILTAQDHRRIRASATMLAVLNHLPGSSDQRRALAQTYLDILNDKIWSASLRARPSVFAALMERRALARPTGFVSDYPMLTTNLARSAALLGNATKLGRLTTLTDPLTVRSTAAGLAASAAALGVAHSEVEVLVANPRDFGAAQSIGMHPRLVAELQPEARATPKRRQPRGQTAPPVDPSSLAHSVGVPA